MAVRIPRKLAGTTDDAFLHGDRRHRAIPESLIAPTPTARSTDRPDSPDAPVPKTGDQRVMIPVVSRVDVRDVRRPHWFSVLAAPKPTADTA